MKINKNLESIQGYQIEILDKNIKRLHANESNSSILPIEILTKNILDNLNYYPEKSYQDLENYASKFYNTENNL